MGEIATKDVDHLVVRHNRLIFLWQENRSLYRFYRDKSEQLEHELEDLRHMLAQREAGLMGD